MDKTKNQIPKMRRFLTDNFMTLENKHKLNASFSNGNDLYQGIHARNYGNLTITNKIKNAIFLWKKDFLIKIERFQKIIGNESLIKEKKIKEEFNKIYNKINEIENKIVQTNKEVFISKGFEIIKFLYDLAEIVETSSLPNTITLNFKQNTSLENPLNMTFTSESNSIPGYYRQTIGSFPCFLNSNNNIFFPKTNKSDFTDTKNGIKTDSLKHTTCLSENKKIIEKHINLDSLKSIKSHQKLNTINNNSDFSNSKFSFPSSKSTRSLLFSSNQNKGTLNKSFSAIDSGLTYTKKSIKDSKMSLKHEEKERLNETNIYQNPNNFELINTTFDTNINSTNIDIDNKKNIVSSSILFSNMLSESDKYKKTQLNIIKDNKDIIYNLDNNEIYMSLELTNDNTKLSILQLNSTNVSVIPLYKKLHNISTVISFFNKTNQILIGEDAELHKIDNPQQTFYNLINFYLNDEKLYKENIWPFDIYNDSNGIYFYITFNNEKNKKIYIEDILVIYIRKVLQLFFNKVKTIEQETLKINFALIVNNYHLTYIKQKKLENLFQQKIFTNMNSEENYISKYKLKYKYDIELNEIYIKNSSFLSALALKKYELKKILNMNIDSKEKYLMVINIEKYNINIQLTSLYESDKLTIYEERYSELLNEGYYNILDALINETFKTINIENRTEKEIKTAVAKLRKTYEYSINNYIKNKKSIEITISKIFKDQDLMFIVDKKKYDEYIESLYYKIKNKILEIFNILSISNLDICGVILQGKHFFTNENYNYTNFMDFIIKELKLNDLIFSEKKNEFYFLVSSACFYYYNKNSELPCFITSEISPYNFGILTYDGKVEYFIKKNKKISDKIKKKILIKNEVNENFIHFYVYQDNRKIIKGKLFKENKNFGNDFIEIYFIFNVDFNLNLKIFYIDDKKPNKTPDECILTFLN